MFLTKIAVVIIAALTLTACSSQYAALSNTAKPVAGYQEKLLNQQSPSALKTTFMAKIRKIMLLPLMFGMH